MGIIDDYYGGYENLAMHTDLDGDVDFDGAYGSACDFHSDNDSDAAVSRLTIATFLHAAVNMC